MGKLWRRALRDCEGSALVEFTLVFPIFMVCAFGTVDVSYMLFEWAQANKATYIGARTAVVSNPVASGVTNLTYSTQTTELSASCFNAADGTANSTASCPTVSTVCTPSSGTGGSCTGGYTFDNTAFTTVFTKMQAVFSRLQRQDVQITYKTNGLGYVGELSTGLNAPGTSGALPMNVTVAIRCMTHQIFFISNFITGAAPGAGCPAGPVGPAIPAFSTTLPSESLFTM